MKISLDTRKALAAAELDPDGVARLVHAAVSEDLAGGPAGAVDATSEATVDGAMRGRAAIVARADGVIAGLPVAAAVFEVVSSDPSLGGQRTNDDIEVVPTATDGERVSAGQPVMTVTGRVRAVLTAERTALNLLCHLSGVATLTRAWVDAVEGTGAAVRDTRKTTPGLRALEKYAVRTGGGVNHRMSLADAALVKDNHVVAAGGVAAAFAAVRERFPALPVEVECDTVAQVAEAVEAGADLILLDNMSLADLRASVTLAAPRGVRLEASGGLRLAAAGEVAATGVDYLAVGALTHSAPILDLGLDLALDLGPDHPDGPLGATGAASVAGVAGVAGAAGVANARTGAAGVAGAERGDAG
jgi:nicotinate-nucleotide pyrophosphorylase (carboxylating)